MASIISCLVMSLMKMMSSTSLLSLGLTMMTMIQGTWLMHLSLMQMSPSMIYLYYSWHILAVFIINIIFNIIIRKLQSPTKKTNDAKEANDLKDSNLTKTVKKNLDTFVELDVGILSSDKAALDHKTSEDIEITNVLNSIDKMVNEQRTISVSEESSGSEKSTINERISPLEEFNTLFRHADCVRKSIKLKESDIV